jgi:RNA polymerase sigma factor (sigma-70 family)
MPPFNTEQLHLLLQRVRTGDEAARDELVRATLDRLEALTRRMLRGFPNVRVAVETGDVLANSLLRMLRGLQAITPTSTRDFFNWAAVQIRRELLDTARRVARQAGVVVPLVHEHEPADPDADLADLERWTQFHETVARIPVEQGREAFEMAFYQGLRAEEIAAALEVNRSLVYRQLRRATLWLARTLGQDLPGA